MTSTKPRRGVPSARSIAAYWASQATFPSGHLSTVYDPGEPSCMACGWYSIDAPKNVPWKGLERAHAVPHYAGGSDNDPANYALLCRPCHDEAPNTTDVDYFWAWVGDHDRDGQPNSAISEKLVKVVNSLSPADVERLRSLSVPEFEAGVVDAAINLNVEGVSGGVNVSTWTRIFREIAATNA